jgi:hypothetical protein
MEETKCLKPPDSGHEFGDRASVQAATRVNAEQTSKTDSGDCRTIHHGLCREGRFARGRLDGGNNLITKPYAGDQLGRKLRQILSKE